MIGSLPTGLLLKAKLQSGNISCSQRLPEHGLPIVMPECAHRPSEGGGLDRLGGFRQWSTEHRRNTVYRWGSSSQPVPSRAIAR